MDCGSDSNSKHPIKLDKEMERNPAGFRSIFLSRYGETPGPASRSADGQSASSGKFLERRSAIALLAISGAVGNRGGFPPPGRFQCLQAKVAAPGSRERSRMPPIAAEGVASSADKARDGNVSKLTNGSDYARHATGCFRVGPPLRRRHSRRLSRSWIRRIGGKSPRQRLRQLRPCGPSAPWL